MLLDRGMMSLSDRWVMQRGGSLLDGVLQDRISGEVGRQQIDRRVAAAVRCPQGVDRAMFILYTYVQWCTVWIGRFV